MGYIGISQGKKENLYVGLFSYFKVKGTLRNSNGGYLRAEHSGVDMWARTCLNPQLAPVDHQPPLGGKTVIFHRRSGTCQTI